MKHEQPPGSGHRGRLPFVDLVRLASILLVFALHLDGAGITRAPIPGALAGAWHYIVRNGAYGVSMFFVVSGFVITRTLLAREPELARLDLRDFYVRRGARILPAFLLAVVAGATLVAFLPATDGRVSYTVHDRRTVFDGFFWLSLFTFSFNWLRILRRRVTATFGLHWDILWSLAIEEQFYLAYPVLLRALRSRRAAMGALGVVVLLGPVARIVSTAVDPGFLVAFTNTFVCVDTLATGCLLAFVLDALPPSAERGPRRWLEHALGLVSLAVLVTVYRFTALADPLQRCWAPSVFGLTLAAAIGVGVRTGWCTSTWMRAVAYPGKLSYGLYLFHPLLLCASWSLLEGHPAYVAFPLFAALAVAGAFVLSRAYERPLDQRLRAWARARIHAPSASGDHGPGSARARLATAAKVAATHLLLGVAVQIEERAQFLRQPSESAHAAGALLARLPFCQLEWVGVACVLGGAWIVWPRGKWAQWLYLAMVTMANVYVALDPAAYRFFFDHFRPSRYEGSVTTLATVWASARVALDLVVKANVAFVALLAWATAMWTRKDALRTPEPLPGKTRTMVAAIASLAVVYLVASAALGGGEEDDNLGWHPLVTLAHDLLRSKEAVVTGASQSRLYDLRYGAPAASADERRAVVAAASELRRVGPAPNVIIVVLESVGSEQLVPMLDRSIGGSGELPHLAALASRGLLFDAVYDVCPSTIRAHLPLNTGGRTVTAASTFDATASPVTGPTLVGELRKAGARTALFSAGDMNLDGLDRLYRGLGYDELFDFGSAPEDVQRTYRLNSWGTAEDTVRERATQWIDRNPTGARFFLQLLTITSHHPYDVPASFHGPRNPTTALDKYLNAISYADAVIGRLLDDLEARSLLDDTLLVVLGDHGEAFGDLHARNVTHGNTIYEESVRTFLWLIDPSRERAEKTGTTSLGVRSHLIGTIGDVMPTVLSVAGLPPVDVPGRDLTSPSYRERIVYFHKNGFPGEYGLRDGRWKMITRFVGAPRPELYDLETDPTEHHNVATAHPDMVALYEQLGGTWYRSMDGEFGATSQAGSRGSGIGSVAPTLKVVTMGAERDDGSFVAEDRVNPWDKVVARTDWEWVPLEESYNVRVTWVGPNQQRFSKEAPLTGASMRFVAPLQDALPHMAGDWTMTITDGNRVLGTRAFSIDPAAPLAVAPEERVPAISRIQVRRVSKTPAADSQPQDSEPIRAGDPIEIAALGTRHGHPYKIWCSWVPPSGDATFAPAIYLDNTAWKGCEREGASQRGTWRAALLSFDRATTLAEAVFVVE